MLNIVLFGPPGAGKGTQSQKLIQRYGLVHLSTGDLLRSQIAQGTELGLTAKKLMDAGELVPDAVVIGMIESQLASNTQAAGFIFDGFPRTIPQAEALDALLQRYDTGISCMVALEVTEDELVKRLLERGKTSGRPDDQNEELIRRRVVEYNTKTAQVASYYAEQDKFHAIPGIGAIDDIFSQLCGLIDSHQPATVTDGGQAANEVKA
ncbi:adenylate kinase [Hymenobacter sp. B81]|uniref:adenylate kinase n=1 Tax=Hymenobacter sp. B81 TaxID=3344878 RepID=UPI0037DCD8A0